MARGKKLDLGIGAKFDSGWSELQSSKPKVSKELLEPQKHQLYFSKEKRRGKTLTLVGPFCITEDQAKTLLKKIKKSLGAGGAYKEQFMEFQGEQKEKLKSLLQKEGYRFKQGH